MKLIIGLGNPGAKYSKTRHNVGWLVLDSIAGKNKWQDNAKAKAMYLKTEINGEEVELLKPTTFMNNSGAAVAYAVKKHNLKLTDIIVIHDDKDIDFGKIKVTSSSRSAGHNGVKSVIEQLGSQDFTRIRVGIRNELLAKLPTDQFVLKNFTAEEKKQLPEIIKEVVKLIK